MGSAASTQRCLCAGVHAHTQDQGSEDNSVYPAKPGELLQPRWQVCRALWQPTPIMFPCANAIRSRDSSVGRASDRRSEGPQFDPGSRQRVGAIASAYTESLSPSHMADDGKGGLAMRSVRAPESSWQQCKPAHSAHTTCWQCPQHIPAHTLRGSMPCDCCGMSAATHRSASRLAIIPSRDSSVGRAPD